jgi:N-acetylglutamate synthase-like GNAT family acetyltransferase
LEDSVNIERILKKEETALQIAELVNTHNRWKTTFTAQGILRSPGLYIVESFDNVVLGVVGIYKINNKWSEVRHLVVRPEIRKEGLGKRLVERALEEVETPFIFANVRSDNIPSLKIFTNLGFVPRKKTRKNRYDLYSMVRFTDDKKNKGFLNKLRS